MWRHDEPQCNQILIDLLCYEMSVGSLSPEMEQILRCHLDECPACKRKFLNFRETLDGHETYH